MADYSGRTDLAVGDLAEAGAHVVDYEAETAVTKGQTVYFSSAGKVSPTSAAGQKAAGIALKTVAIGGMVPVVKKGKVKVTAGGVVAVGAIVGTGGTGKVLAIVFAGTYSAADALGRMDEMLGKNEGAAAAADGDLILIRVNL